MTHHPSRSLSSGAVFFTLLILLLTFAGFAQAEPDEDFADENATAENAPADVLPLGDFDNPVRCDGPRGERYYLARLVAPDGEDISFSREGSFGIGPYGNVLDGYEVVIGERTIRVFMDMYHTGYKEDQPITGLDMRCRVAWDLVVRADGLRYEIGADEPYDGEFIRTDLDTGNTIATMELEDGMIQGSVMQYDAEGVLRAEIPYENNVEHGLGRYFDDRGWKLAEINFEAGERHGSATWFNMDANIETKAQYDRGQPAGEWHSYYPGGEKMSIGSYRDGQRHGEWLFYDGAGTITERRMYEAGEVVDANSTTESEPEIAEEGEENAQ